MAGLLRTRQHSQNRVKIPGSIYSIDSLSLSLKVYSIYFVFSLENVVSYFTGKEMGLQEPN